MFQYTSAPWQVCAVNHAAAFIEGPRGALIGATDMRAIGMTQAAVRGNNALLTAAPLLFAAFEQLLSGRSADEMLAEILREADRLGAREHAIGPWSIVQRAVYVVVCAGNGMPLLASTLTPPRRLREFVGSIVLAGAAPELYHAGTAYISQPAADRADCAADIRRLIFRMVAQAADLVESVKNH